MIPDDTGNVVSSDAESLPPTPPLRFSAVLAGLYLGLVSGAVYLGLSFPENDTLYTLEFILHVIGTGAAILTGACVVCVLPVMYLVRKRNMSANSSLVVVVISGLGMCVLIAIIIETFSISDESSYRISPPFFFFLPSALFCLTPVALLAKYLSRRPRLSMSIIIVVACAAMVGLIGSIINLLD